ncbi:MAG: serine/threonine protein kinase [Deltaproteobacteria bacterium]|nr:serine/threonine protein kinase [Deltaproteobacteria bacterium]
MSRRCLTCGAEFPDQTAFCGNDASILVEVQPPGDEVDPRLGSVVSREWMITAVVADGAMGRVYEARHVATRERAAIKILHPHVREERVSVERFKREAETATTLAHPHVVEIKSFTEQPDGAHVMVMEYLEGEELSVLLRREPKLPFPRLLRIAAQTALALEHAHGAGVFHRDLKPDNLYIVRGTDGDVVKILDFGSVKREDEQGAKLTAWGTTLGSPFYMSPEQAMGTQLDRRSDVWALGTIVYEMVTGKIAFDAPNPAKVLVRIMSESPPWASTLRPDSPPALDDAIERALVRERDQRTGSARALAEQIGAALGVAWPLEHLAAATEAELAAAMGGAPVPARLSGSVPIARASLGGDRPSLDRPTNPERPVSGRTPHARAADPARSAETWVPADRSTASSSSVQTSGTPMLLWIVAGLLGAMLAVAMAFAAWIWLG